MIPPGKTMETKNETALQYHLLETMIGTPAEPPVDEFFVNDALDALEAQLQISPFVRSRVRQTLRNMAHEGLVARHSQGRRAFYCVTDMGRRAYNGLKEVMEVWRLEKNFGERMTLTTITRISPRKKNEDKLYMPGVNSMHFPFKYQKIQHRFEGDREIRVYKVTERRDTI